MVSPKLSIFARLPVPGQVKTRLVPAVGEEGAARIYARLLAHTVEVAKESGLDFELRVTGGEVEAFHSLFGSNVAVVDQGGGDLGAKMARVEAPALLIGSDCPGISVPLLQAAAGALDDRRVVLGPANDGGYYLIGFTEPVPFLFEDMEWSTPKVLPETLTRLAARGYGPAILPELADIDTGEDLAAWPEFE
ncbi:MULTISPECIES: TIGR04282 family arsenosugar biosynthesis glycosyltransferase [Qipengyuania]|uniref:TIGR04282 family arsenosugar biosynthesis glycosyltransferase n=2 Tax=Qipengyuania TaxID=1855416 RepID=A0A9Q3S1X3_9SPHN|nr:MULTISPECIES: TIGR04282 family arsenosugar biosynthesis glycosyltransferase [Qipengyuania]MBY6218674.1 TIGR04282 family arsenosugar biosynthesis glycosyltransferase [Qipengyuania aquimaris]QZD93607.1 TIGR04282 family arsenosugar biosynthesis glycosyltransferase [Qipengyuania xiapuensis]